MSNDNFFVFVAMVVATVMPGSAEVLIVQLSEAKTPS